MEGRGRWGGGGGREGGGKRRRRRRTRIKVLPKGSLQSDGATLRKAAHKDLIRFVSLLLEVCNHSCKSGKIKPRQIRDWFRGSCGEVSRKVAAVLALAAIVIFLMAQQASLVAGESEVEATMYACDAPLDVRWIVLCVWHDWNRLDIKPGPRR